MDKAYLDYNASTPVAPEVSEAMKPFLVSHYGNPSAAHWGGLPAKKAYENAREKVADFLNSTPQEIIFTSGGSETNNHVLKGVFYSLKEKGNHIITSVIEHPAVINPCKFLEKFAAEVTYVGVDKNGQVSSEEIEKAITDKTILISIMHANNETGVIQPIQEISRIARRHDVLFHTDAAQSVGKIDINVDELGVDFLSVAGHKVYAPKGIGALYIKEGIEIESLIHGAGHERGRRAGTENVMLGVGLGRALEEAKKTVKDSKIKELRDYFWEELKKHFKDEVVLNGHPEMRLPNTLNVNFKGRIGADILEKMPEVAASTGSACHSGLVELSSVLKAMQVPEEVGKGAIRFSLGRYTTREEIDYVLDLIKTRI